jgi:hypothetical protein
MHKVHSTSRRVLAVAFAVPVVSVSSAACSAFEPEVGPRQQSAVTGAPTGGAADGYGSRPDSGADGGDPRCLADGGYQDNPCDACENTSCCATRFGCYDDPTCKAANTALDGCITAAVDAYKQPDPVAVKKCWDTFAASGAAGAARVDCQRAKCRTICGVP